MVLQAGDGACAEALLQLQLLQYPPGRKQRLLKRKAASGKLIHPDKAKISKRLFSTTKRTSSKQKLTLSRRCDPVSNTIAFLPKSTGSELLTSMARLYASRIYHPPE